MTSEQHTPLETHLEPAPASYFGRGRIVLVIVVAGLFLLGALVRLIDLTDPPLDFHSTRQLRNSIVARGLYYQMLPEVDPALREKAVNLGRSVGQYEPPLLESLVAATYLAAGQELPWIARLYTTLFWLVGGLALFDLARRMTNIDGAVVATGFYLLLPFAAQASRSFQPDPGMVMWFTLFLNFVYRWSEDRRWRWVVLAGLTAGMAALTKVVIGYMIAGGAVAIVLATSGFTGALRSRQVWSMAGLMILPTALYYLAFTPGGRITEYVTSWTLALLPLLADPAFYVRWMGMLHNLFGLTLIFVGLIGVLISSSRNRIFLAGLWVGYLIYGLTLPYQMYTHNYYHLQLTPLLALSMAPLAALVFDRVARQPRGWQLLLAGALLLAAFYPAWVTRSDLFAEDYRNEQVYWQEIAQALPEDGKIIALIQDYGFRLMYFGMEKLNLWPNTGEQELSALRGSEKSFDSLFANKTEGHRYFLVTAMGQYNQQPELRSMLENNFPVIAEGDGYLIFDLSQAKSSP
jgi:hypothetical protein